MQNFTKLQRKLYKTRAFIALNHYYLDSKSPREAASFVAVDSAVQTVVSCPGNALQKWLTPGNSLQHDQPGPHDCESNPRPVVYNSERFGADLKENPC